MACFLPAVSNVACAQAEGVKAYVSNVSMSFPDPAGVDDIFSKNKDAVEVTLGFVAPQGCKFIKGSEKSKVDVTDSSGARKKAELNGFFAQIPDSGAFAKCPLRLKQKAAFPVKLTGTVKMKVSEGTETFPAQEFDARKDAKFQVNGMEITVKEATGQGKASGSLQLEFKDTLGVEEITLTDGKDGKVDARCVSKSSFSFGSVSTRIYTYEIKSMPAKMKAAVAVNKGARAIDIPVKMTVDLNVLSE